jgi:hypothetical protein
MTAGSESVDMPIACRTLVSEHCNGTSLLRTSDVPSTILWPSGCKRRRMSAACGGLSQAAWCLAQAPPSNGRAPKRNGRQKQSLGLF